MKRCVLHLASIVVIVASTGCDKFPEEQTVVSEQIMGTTITVTSIEGADAVFDIFREVDETMSESEEEELEAFEKKLGLNK